MEDLTPPTEEKTKKSLSLAILLPFLILGTVVILAGAVGLYVLSQAKSTPTEVAIIEENKTLKDPFDSLEVSAKAAYVVDVGTGEVLYAKNEEIQLPLASITKLMTAIIATENLSLDGTITIAPEDLRAEGDSGLTLGETWSIRDLLSFTLVVSSNDGAHALASAAGAIKQPEDSTLRQNKTLEDTIIEIMNKKAREIGLTQTYFLNPTGLDGSEEISGGYGSARDATSLLHYALLHTPLVLEATSNPQEVYYSLDAIAHEATNTNQIIDTVPGFIAGKTGLTDLAGGNLVIAFDAGVNRPVLIAVLGSSEQGRFEDVEKLVDATLESIALQ